MRVKCGGGGGGAWFLPMAYLDSPACHTLVISVNACLTHDKNIRALAVADHRWIIAMLKIIERCTGQSISDNDRHKYIQIVEYFIKLCDELYYQMFEVYF